VAHFSSINAEAETEFYLFEFTLKNKYYHACVLIATESPDLDQSIWLTADDPALNEITYFLLNPPFDRGITYTNYDCP